MDEQQNISKETAVVQTKKNSAATTSLVLGIIGVVTGLFLIGSILGIIAIIFGIIALVRAGKSPEIGGKGKAIAGIILGAIAIILIFFAAIFSAIAIPRFMAASKKAKISEARLMMKKVWEAAGTYYEANGLYPPPMILHNASTKNNDWNDYPGLIVEHPTKYPRFSYKITKGGTDFEFTASSQNSWDNSLWDVSPVKINIEGVITGGTF